MVTLVEGENEVNVSLEIITVETALYGVVVDKDGAPLDRVKVTLEGATFTAYKYTNTAGGYEFINLVPGSFTITFEKEGYQTVVR